MLDQRRIDHPLGSAGIQQSAEIPGIGLYIQAPPNPVAGIPERKVVRTYLLKEGIARIEAPQLTGRQPRRLQRYGKQHRNRILPKHQQSSALPHEMIQRLAARLVVLPRSILADHENIQPVQGCGRDL